MSNDYNGKKRSELPDSVFGIPQERKYPMPDEKHTRSAIKLFNHVDPKYEEQLAKAVIKNMKKYGIDGSAVGPNNRLRKYLPKDMIKEFSIEEGYFKSTDNLEFNLDKWSKSGNHNLLYITGISGSGKTTLAKEMCKKYKAEYIELDKFTLGIVKGLDRWFENVNNGTYEVHPLLKEYFSQLDHLTTNGSWSKPDMGNEHDKFLTWFIKKVKGNGTLYIVEGAQFFMKLSNMDPDLIKGEPLIIVGTSAFKSWIRRIKRDTANDETISRFIYHLKKDIPMLFKYYFSNEQDLQKYIKNMQSNINESYVEESSHKSDFSYSRIKTSSEKSEFKRNFREVFKEDPTESSVNYMQMIKYKGDLVGYIGFSRYKEGKKKYLGIGNFMILKRYQRSGMGSKVISDIIDRYKDNYDEIYCYVDKDNTNAIAFYKKIAKVNTDNLTKYGYYVTLYSKSIGESSVNENEENYILPILELQKRLSKFKYGVPINGKIKNVSEIDFSKEYKTLTSKEFEKYEAGVCWDFANYQEIELAKIYGRSSVQNYYFIVDKEPNYPTHTITIVKIGSYFYYPEASWGKMMGVYRDKSISHILNTVAKKLSDEAGSAEYVECRKYSSYDRLTKLSPIEYMNKMNTMTKVQVSLKESKLQKVTKYNINESVSILPQDTGISTVIFDIGDVLVSANIKDYLVADPEVPNEIVDELLKLWFIDKDEVDDTMDLNTYREIVNKRMGVEFSNYIPKLFKYNVECVTAFDYTIPMIQDLKDKGYKVYYLSNWSAWTYDLLQEAGKFDFLKLMDGGVFSYDAGYMKPNEEIYKILLNKYKINPEEAVFFDDREENIETANKLGIHGIHFPRHDASIVYNNLYGRKLAKTIYEDMDNIRYDFDQSYNDKVFGVPSIQEYGTTGGTIVGANQPDSVYIVNYMQNNVFSGYKEPKQAICKKGMNQMYTTKNGKAIPVDIDKFKEEASDISVFRFKETPILSFDKIIENASVDGDFYILLTGDYPTNQHEIEYDNRFIQEDNFFDKLDDITYCTESTIIGQIEATDYPYMKILTESMEGRCWNYYRDINGVFAMNELTGLRTPSYEDITDIPNSQIQLIERGTVYFGD